MTESPAPRVSVVITTQNSARALPFLFESLWSELRSLQSFELFVVDNASTDDTGGMVREALTNAHVRFSLPEDALVFLRNDANIGYARANNQSLVRARGRSVLLLNPDVGLEPDALLKSLCFLESNPDIGIVGPRILLLDGKLDQACRRSFKTPGIYVYKWTGISRLFPRSRRFGRYYLSYLDETELKDVDSVMGAFLLIRREAQAAIGQLDEGFFMYSEDEDWCYRAKRAGWRVVYYPESVVWHLKGHSTRQHTVRLAAARHYSYLRFHRKNLAVNYPAFVNGIVYAGILVGQGFALTKHLILRVARKHVQSLYAGI